MIYAQVKDSLVINTIVLDDTNLIPLFSSGYDYFIEISDDPGSPAVGWSYDPILGFSPPVDNG